MILPGVLCRPWAEDDSSTIVLGDTGGEMVRNGTLALVVSRRRLKSDGDYLAWTVLTEETHIGWVYDAEIRDLSEVP